MLQLNDKLVIKGYSFVVRRISHNSVTVSYDARGVSHLRTIRIKSIMPYLKLDRIKVA